MQKRPFTEFGLSAEVLKAVDKLGFEEASPIQTAAFPPALAGKDVIGQSSTGSGKTAAFAIPAIERIDPHVRAVQVLILCPTRELAVQVAEEVGKLSLFKRGIHSVPIYGGAPYERQYRALQSGVQIVIGTPGRVIDHMEQGTLKIDALRMLILDEADRMLDMGFREDIERILSQTPKSRQTLFFSATMPRPIQQLIKDYTREPEWVKIEEAAQNALKVDQVYFEVERRSKLEVLTRLIDLHDFRYGIIFCSTKIMVDELCEHMVARGYAVDRLHGDISQAQRNRVMERFRNRKFEFLIATDVAARGLDVEELEVVFNFDLPNDAEDYTHRIGRTGRAGKSGQAFTFVSGRELYKLQGMVRFAKLKIRRENVPSMDQVEEARVNVFFEKLRSLLESGDYTKYERIVDRLLEQGYPSTDIASALIHMLSGADRAGGAGGPGAEAPHVSSERDRARRQRGEAESRGNRGEDFRAQPSLPAASHELRGEKKPRDARESEAPRPVHSERTEHSDRSARTSFSPAGSAVHNEGPRKEKYERPSRTGREEGKTTLFLGVGRKQLITPADIVGKIAGVTRLPSSVVGAIDIHQRHTLVDVDAEQAALIVEKLGGVRMKGEVLKVALATDKDVRTE